MAASTSPTLRQLPAAVAGPCSWAAVAGPAAGASGGSVGRPAAGEKATGAGVTEGPTPGGRGGRVSITSGAAEVGGGSGSGS